MAEQASPENRLIHEIILIHGGTEKGILQKRVNQVWDLIWLVYCGGIVRHKVAECRMVFVGAV